MKIQRIKRKDLDVEKYSRALENAMNYRIYAEYWYLDVLTNEKWECLVYGDYEVIMPIPLQFKLGIKFVLQPTYCQQLGVFYRDEISNELFSEFEKMLHSYRVRAYHFNEENTERFHPKGEKRVNHVLDLNRPYEEIYLGFNTNRKRNIGKAEKLDFELNTSINLKNYLELIQQDYPRIFKTVQRKINLLEMLNDRNCLMQNTIVIDDEINCTRLFIHSKNRIFDIGSARNKKSELKLDFGTYLISSLIQNYSNQIKLLDFEGSMIKGIASFNESFGAEQRFYTKYANQMR